MKMLKLPTGKRWGSALIIVLASLVFVSALIIAFLTSMRSKLVLSKSGSDAINVKMLAETAVNIAISQVRDATLKSGSKGMAWASQPGMIRLYSETGADAGYYKLYSADNMVVSDAAFNPTTEVGNLNNWDKSPAVFTDLNAPTNGVFPILDYSAASALVGGTGISLGTVPSATTDQPAPMPVKWLYLLADGTLYPAPTGSGSSVVISAATSDNPIVGRIAFWTDDETCKANVNTASLGTFWSTPRFNTTGDQALASSQPVRGEFQRYPGHPATVSLNAIFPTLTNPQIFAIAPRLGWGGSEAGTKIIQNVTTWLPTTDHDRLYDSVDEILFKVPATGGTNREQQDGLTPSMVKASEFFLTASSRAPELNLFGLPRIVTWPIHAVNDNNYRTANDRLLAFCGTLGTGTAASSWPFYFTRQNNLDPSNDIMLSRNQTLLNYLDRLTGLQIPGFGGSFQGKYSRIETRQILTEIYDYIRCTNLFDCTTPQSSTGVYPYAFGISSRYTKGNTNHLNGSSLGTAVPAFHTGWQTRGYGGRFLQISAAHIHFVGLGSGTGAGASGTESAVAINALQIGARDSTIVNNVPPSKTIAVQAYIYLSTLNPGEGIENWSPGHWIEIEGLDQFKLNQQSMGFPTQSSVNKNEMTIMGNMLGGGEITGCRISNLDPYGFITAQNVPKKLEYTTDTDDSRNQFPFYSSILAMPYTGTSSTMSFTGGKITIKIYADMPDQGTTTPWKHSTDPVETLYLTFPDATFPAPEVATNNLVGTGSNSLANERWSSSNKSVFFENNHDVLRTVPLDKGDIRLVVGPTSTTTSFYTVQPNSAYYSSTQKMVPLAITSESAAYNLLRSGKLVKDASYNTASNCAPYVPDHINGVTTYEGALGDWDNGTSIVGDGPFINAADPGSISPDSTTGNLAYFDNSSSTASTNANLFSPNRQMCGPGMFGSLPTGVQRNRAWQTLLFRPGPPNHPGMGVSASGSSGPPYTTPPDHLFLDLFWMPIVEPYAISEPFSTAGKINMNQQIVPFTYIDRTAGLRAALVSENVAAVAKGGASMYKVFSANYGAGLTAEARKSQNLSETDGTLRQFKEKFAAGKIFRCPSEICDIYLVPYDKSWTTDTAAQTSWYGDDFALVGDNTRERPYADLYNKLTTKSNTYTIHYHVQILQKSKTRNLTAPTIFDPSNGDKVIADQRGATTFERYLDPADDRIINQDPARTDATSLEQYYRARIINSTVFNP
ncbi:MAG: Verru_Chthon cassette protein A [Chthoniobacteraceae bacterium]